MADDKDLFSAVVEGDLRTAVELLQNGVKVEEPGFSGVTPLNEAVVRDNMDIAAALLLFSADPQQKTSSGTKMADLAKIATMKTLLGFFSGEVEIDANNTKVVLGALDKFVRWRMVKQMDALKAKAKAKAKAKPKSKRLEKAALLQQQRDMQGNAGAPKPGPKTGVTQPAPPNKDEPPRKAVPENSRDATVKSAPLKQPSVSERDEAVVTADTLPSAKPVQTAAVSRTTPRDWTYQPQPSPILQRMDAAEEEEATAMQPPEDPEPPAHTLSLLEQLERQEARMRQLWGWAGGSIQKATIFDERKLSQRYAAFNIQKPPSLEEAPGPQTYAGYPASSSSTHTAPVEFRPPSPPRSLPYLPFGPPPDEWPPPKKEKQVAVAGQSSSSSSQAAPVVSQRPRPRGAKEEALSVAVQGGNLQEVIQLLLGGADPEAPDFAGETPLFDAVVSGDGNIAAALLLLGADAERQSASGASVRSFSNSPETSTLLALFTGTKVTAEDQEMALQQLLPGISWAVTLYLQGKDWAARQRLQDFVAAGGAGSSSSSAEPRAAAQQPPVLPAAEDADGDPVTLAVRQGALAEVMRLLEAGADPDVPDELGETPLFEAASCCNADIAVALLLNRANPEYKSSSGQTPMDFATSEDISSFLHVFAINDTSPEMWNYSLWLSEEDLRTKYMRMLNARRAELDMARVTKAFTAQH